MNWGLRKTVLWSVLTVGLVTAAGVMGQGREGQGGAASAPAAPTGTDSSGFPDGDGKKLVMDNCGACHGLDQIQTAKHDVATWTETLDRMMSYGAMITDVQKPTVAAYLAKSFPGAKTDDKKDDPDAAGEKILNTACTACHDLSPVMRQANDKASWESIVNGMIGNGADVKDSEFPVLVNYLVKYYGPPKDAPNAATPGPPPAAAPAGRGARGQ